MSRRFITVEDVSRVSGTELLVDPNTVVTPQALEAAASAGIQIRTSDGGSYAEPSPDRGPDAERATHHLPHLPEPEGGMATDDGATGVVVTAVGKNRPGVLAEITRTLGERGASVVDISQRTVDAFFHLVLTVELNAGASFGDLKSCMECLGGEDDFVVRVMHERVFRFMHRI